MSRRRGVGQAWADCGSKQEVFVNNVHCVRSSPLMNSRVIARMNSREGESVVAITPTFPDPPPTQVHGIPYVPGIDVSGTAHDAKLDEQTSDIGAEVRHVVLHAVA
jgi:hypothetical protein